MTLSIPNGVGITPARFSASCVAVPKFAGQPDSGCDLDRIRYPLNFVKASDDDQVQAMLQEMKSLVKSGNFRVDPKKMYNLANKITRGADIKLGNKTWQVEVTYQDGQLSFARITPKTSFLEKFLARHFGRETENGTSFFFNREGCTLSRFDNPTFDSTITAAQEYYSDETRVAAKELLEVVWKEIRLQELGLR